MWVPKARNIFIGLCAQPTGPNWSQLHCSPMAPPLFHWALLNFCHCHSHAVLLLVLGFQRRPSRRWIQHVLDNGASPCLSIAYCHLSLPLATPVEHCAHSKSPSGFAIRVLRFGPEIQPRLFLQASPQHFSVAHPPLPLILFYFYSYYFTCNLITCTALLSLRLINWTGGIHIVDFCCCYSLFELTQQRS